MSQQVGVARLVVFNWKLVGMQTTLFLGQYLELLMPLRCKLFALIAI